MSAILLDALRARAAAADPALAADLEAAVRGRRDERTAHTEWGLLCEQTGLFHLAFSEFQLALRDQPDDPVAAFRLAHHYGERGDSRRAAELLERLLQTHPANEDWLRLYAQVLREEGALPRLRSALRLATCAGLPVEKARAIQEGAAAAEEPPAEEPGLIPTDADCARFQRLFAGREDVHARQWARAGGEGGYTPVREPFTLGVVRNHLAGNYTVGVYPLRLDHTCTFLVLDLDVDRAALEKAHGQPALGRRLRDALHREGLRLLDVLRRLGLAPLFEDSGYKGRHYWVFLERPEPAELLCSLGRQLLAALTPLLPAGLHLEFFPKQAELKDKGLGNLIKLPLGIHRRTGRRATLLDERGRPLADALAALRDVSRVTRDALCDAIKQAPAIAASSRADHSQSATTEDPSTLPPLPLVDEAAERHAPGPPPPDPVPAWTEADFETDPRLRHLLAHCPVLAELKRNVDEHRRLSHEEQLVLIHTVGHVEGGPQAVNYLLGKCVDVGKEKFMKDRLKGNPVSCPSIRKKIGHVTRRVTCHCPFDFAPDRYPSPVLHLLTLPAVAAPAAAAAAIDLDGLARRYGVIERRRQEIEQERADLGAALVAALRGAPDRSVALPGGRYRLVDNGGVEELCWEEAAATPAAAAPAMGDDHARAGDH